MKLAIAALVAASILNGISATPASGLSTSLDLVDDYSDTPYLALFSEKLCDDMTDKLCRDRDGYWMRYSVYDPVSQKCVCSTQPSSYILSKQCRDIMCTPQDRRAYYWPGSRVCFCESPDFFTQSWNLVTEKSYSGDGDDFEVRPVEKFGKFKQKMSALNKLTAEIEAALAKPSSELRMSHLRTISSKGTQKRHASATGEPMGASVPEPIPSFLPPPNPDLTPELLNQSLTVQPNNTATISAVMINIPKGVVKVTFQMNGPIADSITVNASTSMMCGAIGSEPEPEIEIVPVAAVTQGQGSSNDMAVADCLCIAVNMYNPNVINVWVLDPYGRVFALVSSNKIVNIDQLNLTQSVALNLVPIPAGSQKREVPARQRHQAQLSTRSNFIPLQTRQVLKVGCGNACPFEYMRPVVSADGHTCGCVFEQIGGASRRVKKARAVMASEPMNDYSATMSKEECESLRCAVGNNGDYSSKPARLNPLSKVCWCLEPEYH